MEKTKRMELLQQEWREKLQKSFWLIVGISFLMEALIVVVRILLGRLEAGEYIPAIVKSIVVPSLLNILIAMAVQGENHSVQSEEKKNRFFVYGAMALATVIVTFHGYLNWTLCVFALPIIVSVIFADDLLLRWAFFVTLPVMFGSIILSWILDPHFELWQHYLLGVLNAAFLLVVSVICRQIIVFLDSKDEIIEDYDKNEEDLNFALTLDPMTKLFNHGEFERVFESNCRECCRNNTYMTLVVADIDHFKRVNDTYGHEQGDKVLIQISELLAETCADKGQAFRYGGEEFAAIFMGRTAHQTLELMEQFRERVANVKYDFLPEEERITISIGIYKYGSEKDVSIHDIFGRADSAMYTAKDNGRNRCYIYHDKMK